MESAEVTEMMEVHIDRSYTQCFYKAEDEVAGRQRLDGNWWN